MSDLEQMTRSFLTESPDIRALHECIRNLADEFAIDESTVRTDEFGDVRGELLSSKYGFPGRFSVDPKGNISVEFDVACSPKDDDDFVFHTLKLGFNAKGGQVGDTQAVVQFHPDSRSMAPSSVGEAGENLVGWVVDVGLDGSELSPLSMRRSGSSMRIGPAESIERQSADWFWSTEGYIDWMRKFEDHTP